MRRIVNERNTKRKKAAIILKRTAAAAMCVILAAGMTACGKKADSAQSESVSENDLFSCHKWMKSRFFCDGAFVCSLVHQIFHLQKQTELSRQQI